MQGKIMFALGAAVGYVFGTRTGRQGYERLKKQASDFWQNERVQRTVQDVEDFAKDKIPVVGEKVSDVTEKLSRTVKSKNAAGSTGAASSAGTGASASTESSMTTAPSTSSTGDV